MADGVVQVPPDNTGKKIDTTELTRADTSVVERQRVAIPDFVSTTSDIHKQTLIELRIMNLLLLSAFGLPDDLDRLRDDLSNQYHVEVN